MKTKLIAIAWTTVLMQTACGPTPQAPKLTRPDPVVARSQPCPAPIVGENLRVTEAVGESNSPILAWNGDVFPIAWWDMRGRLPTVHLARVDSEGVHRAPMRQMPNVGTAREQSVACDSEEIHLVWLDEGKVSSARFGPQESEPVMIAESASSPAAGPWGAAAWVQKGNLQFRCDGMLPPPDRDGVRAEPEPTVLGRGGIDGVAMAWNGEHYAVVWSQSVKGGRDIVMQRVTSRGNRLGPTVKISGVSGVNRRPEITWSGNEYAVAWTNEAPKDDNPNDSYRIFLAVISETGTEPRFTRQLEFRGSAEQVALAANGHELAIAWLGSKQPMGSAVYFRRLDLDGQPTGETLKVTDDVPLTCGRPSLTWAGNGYGVTWHDDREAAGSEVFFSFLACGDEDDQPQPEITDGGTAEPVQTKTDDIPALKEVF